MYYIFLQLKTGKFFSIDKLYRGEVWTTHLTKKSFRKGDSLEQFIERNQVEILGTEKTQSALRDHMLKFDNYCNRMAKVRSQFPMKSSEYLDSIRKFFKG